MKRLLIRHSLTILSVIFLLVNLKISLAFSQNLPQPSVSLNFNFDKIYYSTSDEFILSIRVANNTTQSVKNIRVYFSITEPKKPEEKKIKKVILSRSLYKNKLSPGFTAFEVREKISQLKLREGVYPIKFILKQRGKIVEEINSSLIIVNRLTPPLNFALVLPLEENVHFNSEGIYLDDELVQGCDNNPQLPGIYFLIAQIISLHNSRVNLVFSPILLEQLKDLSDGYKILDGERVKSIPSALRGPSNTKKLLQLLKSLITNQKVEVLFLPYASPSLPSLVKRGWHEDFNQQIKEGEKVARKILELPNKIEGVYPPNLNLDSKSFSLLSGKVKYVVGRSKNLFPYQPVKKNNLLFFPIDLEASSILSQDTSHQLAVQDFLAYLAKIYLSNQINSLVVVDFSDIKPGRLEVLLFSLEKVPWVKARFLREFTNFLPQKIKFVLNPQSESSVEKSYYEKVKKTRELFNLFLDLTMEENPLREKLKRFLLIAENRSFSQAKDFQNKGMEFLQAIQNSVEEDLKKIKVSETKITLASKSGKIPISILNQNNYPLKIRVKVSCAGLSFPKGGAREYTLNPKENILSFPVVAEKYGQLKLSVRLESLNGKLIKTSAIPIASTYLSRLISQIFFTLILLAILLLILRYQLKKGERFK